MGSYIPGWNNSLPKNKPFDPKAWLAKNPQARAFSRPDIIVSEHEKVLRDMRQNPAAMENHWNKNRYAGFEKEIGTLTPEQRQQVMNHLRDTADNFFTVPNGDKRSLLPGFSNQQYKSYEQHFDKLRQIAGKKDASDRITSSWIKAGGMGAMALATGGLSVPFLSTGLAMGSGLEATSAIVGMGAQSTNDSKKVAEYEFWQKTLSGASTGTGEYGAISEGFDKSAKLLSKAKFLPGWMGKTAQIGEATWNASTLSKAITPGFAAYNTMQFGSQVSKMHSALDAHKKSDDPGTPPDIDPESLGKSLSFSANSIYDSIPSFKGMFSRKPFGQVSSNKNILDEVPRIGGDVETPPIQPTPPGDYFWSPKPKKVQDLFNKPAPKSEPPVVKQPAPKSEPSVVKHSKAPEPPPVPKEQPPSISDPKYDKYFSGGPKPPTVDEQVEALAKKIMSGQNITDPTDLQLQANHAELLEEHLKKYFINRELPKNRRKFNNNSRATGENPRAKGENPRAKGENPRAKKKPPETPKVDPEKANKQGELFNDGNGNTTYLPMAPWAMGAMLAMGQRTLPKPTIKPPPKVQDLVPKSNPSIKHEKIPDLQNSPGKEPTVEKPSLENPSNSTKGSFESPTPRSKSNPYPGLSKLAPEELPRDLEMSPPLPEPPKLEPGKGLEFKPLPLPEVQTPPMAMPKPPGAPGALPGLDLTPQPAQEAVPEEDRVPIPKTEVKPKLDKPDSPPPVGAKTDPPKFKDSDEIMNKLMPFLSLLGAGGDAPSFPSVAHGIPAQSAPSFEKTHLDISYFTDLGL